ncbi:MAG: tetratricopeptide repeat protein, partial [Leptospiraceae bacterium]|nr:tetratricopeptide repeat protein [Leptospiraceae bacterium]
GRYNEAVDVGERLFLRDPNNFLNLVNLSASYLELKIYKRAETMISRALDKNPDDSVAIQLKFAIDRAKKNIPDEEKEDEEIIISKEEIEKLIKEADQNYAAKRYVHAQNLYERILRGDEQNSYVLFRVANCSSLTGHLEDAIKYYNRALVLAPGNHHARNNLASTYYRIGKYEQAKEQWTRAINLRPGFKTAELNLSHLEKIMEEKSKVTA